MSKKLEDLTLEEIKAQMSIYQTLYYKKRKQEDPEFAEKMKQKDKEKYLRKKEREGTPTKTGNKKYNHAGLIAVAVA
jgi:hypothetical protein